MMKSDVNPLQFVTTLHFFTLALIGQQAYVSSSYQKQVDGATDDQSLSRADQAHCEIAPIRPRSVPLRRRILHSVDSPPRSPEDTGIQMSANG
jgi:hypothetical protein